MKFKIFIIGGAGFVGSHLTTKCLKNGHEVVIYDNFSRGRREFLPDDPNLKIIEGDIADINLLTYSIDNNNPNIIFHLAAIHFIPACEETPENAIRVNIEGTQNVLNALKDKGKNLIFASTGAIYDPSVTVPLNEESPIKTGDIYGITKLSCEELIKYHVNKGRGKVIIARLFNVVGTNETNPHLIPVIMDQLSKGFRHIQLGNLFPKRDYVHVEDVADALYSLASTPLKAEIEIFNIGSGVEYSVGELVGMCSEVIGEEIEIESVKTRQRKNDRLNQLADINKINSVTGWKPSRSLEQALKEVWQLEINVNLVK
ncbi:MAG: NAD-dependent epimerase/dehydratase family protein [Bacteroidales bacterium]